MATINIPDAWVPKIIARFGSLAGFRASILNTLRNQEISTQLDDWLEQRLQQDKQALEAATQLKQAQLEQDNPTP